MKILALNCGSSSVKYVLYDWEKNRAIARGGAERIGIAESFVTCQTDNTDHKVSIGMADHKLALDTIIDILIHSEFAVLKDASEIAAVGHRVVHGGRKFTQSMLIDKNVEYKIEDIAALAPLHNPPNLAGIRAAERSLPGIPQVAVFDTAFHQTMPEEAFQYAVPRYWYDEYNVRKYGFHGTSHLYVSKRAASMLQRHASQCNLITMHIGNGVSCTAIKNGLSVDTSMGMTPLEGAIMGTRCGDIDPAVPLYMLGRANISEDEMYDILNKKSGLLGITGQYVDRRDIQENADKGDILCKLAINMETYRLKQYIGKYMATLGRVDAIVFTAGVGENAVKIREKVLEGLEFFGIELDKEKNISYVRGTEADISKDNSKVKVFVIPTNEEIVLIEDVVGVLKGTYADHMHYKYSFL